MGPDPGPQVPVPAQVEGLEHLSKLEAEQGFDATARGTIAYVAAPSGFYTVDISNPVINVHHWAQPVGQGDVILIADWAATSNAATCDRIAEPLGAVGPPPGAVWAYDISDASNPQPLGFLDVPPPGGLAPNAPCSPHVIEPIEGQDTFVVGWHQAGVALIDASDPANLELLDQWVDGNDAWSVHVHGGLVLAGDSDAGLDILRLAGAS